MTTCLAGLYQAAPACGCVLIEVSCENDAELEVARRTLRGCGALRVFHRATHDSEVFIYSALEHGPSWQGARSPVSDQCRALDSPARIGPLV